ncbi:zinc transporter ZntB [Donghicola sp. C2-DW-16]|uniref:Zinc transporter ZntB n=1 Tax=Donghicola mangrovi TaxID=2729614 RepID=A0ABX2PAP4_9RHOB|nr:zinc transporter ZntB [Donghicola mangrovi]NVO26448.1 zinc transporter ZntB [Donghicola mangrovi]
MTDTSPILLAHILNGPDRGVCDETKLIHTLREDTLGWVHLSGTHGAAEDWIMTHLDYLDPQAAEALLDVDTRPRMMALGDGLMIILRGMNWNEGEDPEDMVSVRMYIDAHRIVTISRKRVRSIELLDSEIRRGRGPESAGAFLVQLIEYLVAGIGKFQTSLDKQAETLEDAVIAQGSESLRREVVDMRLQVIAALRFLVPQRDVLSDVVRSEAPFIDLVTRREIEEEAIKMTRIVEDMEELRDQTMVLREELSGQLSDRLNKNMFVMSMASVIFLPLGFLTGLFGVNVGGMPGVNSDHGFLNLAIICVVIAVVQILGLVMLRWIGRRR